MKELIEQIAKLSWTIQSKVSARKDFSSAFERTNESRWRRDVVGRDLPPNKAFRKARVSFPLLFVKPGRFSTVTQLRGGL